MLRTRSAQVRPSRKGKPTHMHQVGPTDLPHSRTRPQHWIGTAAALAALVGAALAVGPADAAPFADRPPAARAHTVPASLGPDPAAVTLPLACDGLPVGIAARLSADTTGGGTVVTVVAARCVAPNGTPPEGLFLLRFGPDHRPVLAGELISPRDDLTVRSLRLRADGAIEAAVDGYSSDEVPRCCADLHRTYDWSPVGNPSAPKGYSLTVTGPAVQV